MNTRNLSYKCPIVAPKYYKNFRCIADKCRHSCCLGWEIDVDDAAVEKYRACENPYKTVVVDSIEYDGSTHHFKLLDDERCPHLDERGLCRIITELGEGYLCDICREHPRFYNRVFDTLEVGIGLSCEEAARIVLGSDEYDELILCGEVFLESEPFDFDVRKPREQVFSILSDSSLPYAERIKRIREDFDLPADIVPDILWREAINRLEYLNEDNRQIFSGYTSDLDTAPEMEKFLERALAYFVYRHCSSAENETEFRVSLGVSLFLERLLASVSDEKNIFDRARIISEEIEYSVDNIEELKLLLY